MPLGAAGIWEFPFPVVFLALFITAQSVCKMLQERKSYLFTWGQNQQDLMLMPGKRKGQIWEKVIRSGSHKAEHKNIRRGKGRKSVDEVKQLTVVLQTLTVKQESILAVFGSKRQGKDKSCCQMTLFFYPLMISHCQPWTELVINSALNL